MSQLPLHIRLLDKYIKYPIAYDIVITALFMGGLWYVNHFDIVGKLELKEDFVNDFFSDLISTAISLAGFILAALTIIVTFKDNAQSKLDQANTSGQNRLSRVELFVTSRHYKSTIKVFSGASMIFLVIFFTLSLLKLFESKISACYHPYILLASISFISLTVLRGLLVLFTVIDLHIHPNEPN